VDIATVDILERAHKADPEGVRTLGVLTKLDLADADMATSAVEVLQNKTKPLKLGYIAVKNRNNDELKRAISLAEAKAIECTFFKEHPVLGNMQNRDSLTGVARLTSCLTNVLVSRIKDSLPAIDKEVKKQLATCLHDLKALGDPVPTTDAERSRVFISLSMKFDQRFKHCANGSHLSGTNKSLRLYGQVRRCWDTFQQQVHATWPDVLLRLGDKNEDSEDNEDEEGERVKGIFVFGASGDDGKPDMSFREDRFHDKNLSFEDVKKRQTLQLEKLIARELCELKTRGLSEIYNSQALVYFVEKMVQSWEAIAVTCLQNTVKLVDAAQGKLADDVFSAFPELRHSIRLTMQALVHSNVDAAEKQLALTHVNEREPFTLNHYLLDTLNKIRMADFEATLAAVLEKHTAELGTPTKADGTPSSRNVKYASKSGVLSDMKEWYRSERSVGSSNSAQEVRELIAVLHAYFKTASKRYIDVISQNIDSSLLKATRDALFPTCMQLSSDQATMVDLFAEDPQRKARFELLSAKVVRLKVGAAAMERFC